MANEITRHRTESLFALLDSYERRARARWADDFGPESLPLFLREWRRYEAETYARLTRAARAALEEELSAPAEEIAAAGFVVGAS